MTEKEEIRILARQIAQGSIVMDALARLIEQILETAVEHNNANTIRNDILDLVVDELRKQGWGPVVLDAVLSLKSK